MVKPNRTPEQDARVRERCRQADKDASFLFHYQRVQEMAKQKGKLRLDIESDDEPKEKTPPVLITGEDGVVIDIAEE